MKCLIYTRVEDMTWKEECFHKTNPYLLKIVNKPHLEYFIDFCSTLQINEIRIVSNNATNDLSDYFKEGKKWGVEISYNIARPEDTLKRVLLKNFSFCKDDDVLIISDYFFLEHDIKLLKEKSEEIIQFIASHKSKYLQILTKGASVKEIEEEEDFPENPYMSVKLITSVMDYYNLSMDILSNRCCNYVLPGYSSEPRTYLGMNVSYPKSATIDTPVMIGNNVRLGEMVGIGKNSIIGDNIIIESLTNISNSIIYSDSFVGSDLEIDNKIIYHNKLISGKTGQVIIMSDDYLISSISKEKEIGKVQKSIHFIIAFIQIIIQTIPFLLVIPFLYFIHRKYNLTQIYYLAKDKKIKRMFSVDNARKHPFIKLIKKFSLDKYPYLFYVISGKMLLVGNKLFTMTRRHKEIITNLPCYQPGVYSYWESLNQGFSSEEEIHELYYINNNNFWSNLYIYCKINFLRLFW
ncbi:sugar transferase [bacterium]|nr:sugar transferase [bacterium]